MKNFVTLHNGHPVCLDKVDEFEQLLLAVAAQQQGTETVETFQSTLSLINVQRKFRENLKL